MHIDRKIKRSGFSVVELLLVIVIIATLTILVIVGYRGISNKATVASIQADISNASKQIKLFHLSNGNYPATLNCAVPDSTTNKCIKLSGSNTIANYSFDNSISPQGFCINIVNGSNSYKMTSQSYQTPTVGDCSGSTTPPAPYTTPGTYSYTIPAGVTSVQLSAYGAQGGANQQVTIAPFCGTDVTIPQSPGGNGGLASGTLAVSPGNILQIQVGSVGSSASPWFIDNVSDCNGFSSLGGGNGADSYVQLSSADKVRGYGGGGAVAHSCDTYDGPCYGGPGSSGGGFTAIGLTATSTSSGSQSGNGKVVVNFTASGSY